MKKQNIIFGSVLVVLGGYFLSAALGQTARERASMARPRTITVADGSVVPANTTYFLYDQTGTRLMRTFTHGQRVDFHGKKAKKEAPKPPPINCVQINCPQSFGANVTCWKCK
jgi:hypothetical protein